MMGKVRLNFTVLVIAITLYAFLLIYSTALINIPSEKVMAESLANSISWDAGLGKAVPTFLLMPNVNSSVSNLRKGMSHERLRILNFTSLISDSVVFQVIRPVPANGSMIGQPSCVSLSKALAQLSIVVEVGIPIPTGYSFWGPYGELTPENAYLLQQVTGLPFLRGSYEVTQFMRDVNENFRSYPTPGSNVSMKIPYTKYYLVVDLIGGSKALLKALKTLSKTGSICGFNITYVSSWRQSLIKFSGKAFLKPSPLSYLVNELSRLTLKMRDNLGYHVAKISPQWNKLKEVQEIRNGLLRQTLFASLPAVVGLLFVLPLISPPSLLLDESLIRLMKLRGMSYGKLRRSLLKEVLKNFLLISLVVVALLLISRLIPESEIIDELTSPLLLIPALATGLLLSLVHWGLSTSFRAKSYLTSLTTSGKPWIKVKFGLFSWLSLFLGLYFTLYGIINPSILSLQGPPPSIALASIINLINNYLAPFSPIFLGYGLGALLSVNYEELAHILVKVSGDLSKYVSKSLSLSLRNKVDPLMIVSALFIALLASSSVLTAYNSSLLNSSIQGSLGSYVLGYKEVLISNLSDLPSLIRNLHDELGNDDLTLVGEVEGYISWLINSSTYLEPADILFINSSSFLKETYFMNEWVLGYEGTHELMEGLRESNALVILTPYSMGLPHEGNHYIISSVLDAPGVKVKAITYLRGFPALPYLMSSPYLIVLSLDTAGNKEWINAFGYAVKESIVNKLDVKLYAFTKNVSLMSKLRKEGFKTISLDEVRKDPSYMMLDSALNAYFTEYLASIITLFLTAGIALIIEYLTIKELRPLIKLYRLRQLSLKRLMHSLIVVYVLPIIISGVSGALAGYVLGASLAVGSVNNFPPIITLPHSLVGLPIKLSLWLGIPSPRISVDSLSLIVAYVALITAAPVYMLFRRWGQ